MAHQTDDVLYQLDKLVVFRHLLVDREDGVHQKLFVFRLHPVLTLTIPIPPHEAFELNQCRNGIDLIDCLVVDDVDQSLQKAMLQGE